MKFDTSEIDKKHKVKDNVKSEFEKKYGGIDIMPYTMSFVIIKWAVVGLFLFGILGLVFIPILSVKLSMNASEMFGVFKDCIYVYAAFLMAFVGYFVGRGQRAEK